MKTIKIWGLPSHQTPERTSGVDMVRIIQPLKALNGYSDGEVKFKTTVYDIEKEANWDEIAKEYDIIYLNYINNPWGYAAAGAMARKYGRKLVLDLDDSLWNLKPDNPAYEAYKKGGEAIFNFTCICNDVDAMTTTSSYLKHVIMNNTKKKADKIHVFPNYIDLSLYNHKPKFKNTNQIQLMHYGSTTHFNDLSGREFVDGLNKILSEYPNVSVRMVGAFLPRLKMRWSYRYDTVYGHQDIYKWVNGKFKEYMDEADIMIVPLTDDIYNRCKSSIKYIESASAGKPGIWEDIRQYREVIQDGKTGFLASKANDWYRAMKKLIDDVELRKTMGENAYQDVVDNWQMKDHVKEYAEFFKSLLK